VAALRYAKLRAGWRIQGSLKAFEDDLRVVAGVGVGFDPQLSFRRAWDWSWKSLGVQIICTTDRRL